MIFMFRLANQKTNYICEKPPCVSCLRQQNWRGAAFYFAWETCDICEVSWWKKERSRKLKISNICEVLGSMAEENWRAAARNVWEKKTSEWRRKYFRVWWICLWFRFFIYFILSMAMLFVFHSVCGHDLFYFDHGHVFFL